MKKLLTLVLAGGMLSFIACGPSAEEIEREKKRVADSIARADSIKQAEEAARQAAIQDSIAKAQAAEKARQDSIRIADSIAAAKKEPKPKPKTKEQKQKEEAKQVIKGRG
jgi:hypothetical protein